MSDTVELVEVGPRDGLQNETGLVATATKIAFVDALSDAGRERIEVTAFVSPKWIPQLADAEDVMAGIHRRPGTRYSALIPNLKGFERAVAAGADEVAVLLASSETFSMKNVNAGIEEAFERCRPVLASAAAERIPVRGYVSTILHCPYEGRVDPGRTVGIVRRLLELGCYEVSLGDTVGQATPGEIRDLCERLRQAELLGRCAGHFHDTYGMGVANVLTAWRAGIRVFDASAGGLGGCPYAPGASGNVATEDLMYMFEGLGVGFAGDLQAQLGATGIADRALGHGLPGKAYGAFCCRRKREPRN